MDENKTKICKHCQSEISKKAKVCPVCRKKQKKGILKKIFWIYFLVCLVGFIITNFGSDETEVKQEFSEPEHVEETADLKAEVVPEEPEEPATSFEIADMTVNFVEYKIEENAMGEQCLVLYFDFTNNSEESQAFGYTFSVKAFQNGVELEPTFFHVNTETENSTKEIKPGVTLRVAEQFGIEDVSGTIEVEIEPFNIWSDKMLFDYKFSLDE